MKKALILLLAILLLPAWSLADHSVVLEYPEELKISMLEETWTWEEFSVTVDLPQTYSERVDQMLRSELEELWNEAIKELGSMESRENVSVTLSTSFRVSGQSWAGFLMTARIAKSYRSEYNTYLYEDTAWLRYSAKSFDMAISRPITLASVFPTNSEIWNRLSEEITAYLHSYYAELPHHEDSIAAYTDRDALAQMPVLPGAGRFMLSFPLWEIVDEKNQIVQFNLYYSDCVEEMNREGRLQTDNSKRPVIAFTYDDGPANELTTNLLRSLNCYGASATFFVIGEQVDKWSDQVRREMDAGHSIGCHSMHHVYAYKINGSAGLFEDRDECIKQHLTLFGIEPKLFRAPGGVENKYLTSQVGWCVIHWTQSAGDTGSNNAFQTAKHICNQAKNGNIILMHDIQKKSVASANQYMAELYERGFMFATVEELLSINGIKVEPNHIYSDGFGIDEPRENRIYSKK